MSARARPCVSGWTDELARVAVSFPTYAEVLVYAAIQAAVELDLPLSGQAEQLRMAR